MKNKKHAGNTVLLSISKVKINRKWSQIVFTLSVLLHRAEKHADLCNCINKHITRTVKQTPLSEIMSNNFWNCLLQCTSFFLTKTGSRTKSEFKLLSDKLNCSIAR